MKPRFLSVLLGVFYSFGVLHAQVSENFDGNALSSAWKGDVSKFEIEDGKLVLSDEGNASTSYLSTYSTSMDDCMWETTVRLNFKPSGSNYVRIYLTSSSIDFKEPLNGYYLQIGNSDKKVLLYQMKNKTSKKLAESEEDRLNAETIELSVKVTRSKDAEWKVYTLLNDEKSFKEEFSVVDSTFKNTSFSGIYCKYSKTNATKISFDQFKISGEAVADEKAAAISKMGMSDSMVVISFDEWVNEDYLKHEIEPKVDHQTFWNPSHTELSIKFEGELQKGTQYLLHLSDIRDFVGNAANDTTLHFARTEMAEANDLLFTEVLFNPNKEGSEFVELINVSDKAIDLAELKFSTRKSADSSLYSAKQIANEPTLIFPKEIKVLTSDISGITRFYTSEENNFIQMNTFPSLRNETGAIVLFRAKDSLVIDNFYYESAMHEESIENDGKGVSLERTSLNSNKWVSAASINGYATPGYWSGEKGQGNNDSHSEEIEISAAEICQPYNTSDNFFIRYKFSLPNYRATVKVYSLDGLNVSTPLENETLGMQGELHWDGTGKDGKALAKGPYIVRLEATHAQSGKWVTRSFVIFVTEP